MRVKHDVDPLKVVLVHQPGKEIEQLTPNNLARLLFDDMPFLEKAINEHSTMTQYLKKHNIKVYDIKDLSIEILQDKDVKIQWINSILHDLKTNDDSVLERVKSLLLSYNDQALVDTFIEGMSYESIGLDHATTLFVLDPLPNLLFQRDPMFMIDDICVISHMQMKARKRESIMSKFVVRHHPLFRNQHVIDMNLQPHSIEGGDILVLDHYLLIGLSERTSLDAVWYLENQLKALNKDYEVIVIELPKERSYMHLDTVLTPISKDVFVYDSYALSHSRLYMIKDGKKTAIQHNFESFITNIIPNTILIEVGDGDNIYAKREQWNDAANTVAVEPNHIICYDRNTITNQLFQDTHIKFYAMPSSELSRGRGGPHCMTMPLDRKSL